MSIRPLAVCVLCVGLIFGIAVGKDRTRDRSEFGRHLTANQIAVQKIEKALASKDSYRFDDVPLSDVLDQIEEDKQISIWLDRKQLSDAGVSTDQSVTLKVRSMPLRHVLDLLLEPLTLTYVIEDGVLKITTSEAAEEKMTTRVYPVHNLIDDNDREYSYAALIRSVQLATPQRWADLDGEGGQICAVPIVHGLVIRQTQKVHRTIEGLMGALRRADHLPRRPSIPANPDDPEELFFDEYEPRRSEGRGEVHAVAE